MGEWNYRAAAAGRNTALRANYDCAIVGQTAADLAVSANRAIVGQGLVAGDRRVHIQGGIAVELARVPFKNYAAPIFSAEFVGYAGRQDEGAAVLPGAEDAVAKALDASRIIAAGCGHNAAADGDSAAIPTSLQALP